jgi:hypothetical protein
MIGIINILERIETTQVRDLEEELDSLARPVTGYRLNDELIEKPPQPSDIPGQK